MGLLNGSNHISTRLLVIVGVAFGLIVALALMISFLIAEKARQEIANRQELVTNAPLTPTKRQVKRIYLERDSPEGTEYIEITWNGTINIYDKNHQLKKTGLQGFARINSIFDDIDRHWNEIIKGFGGNCRLTIETNLGNTEVNCGGNNTGGNGSGAGSDIIKEIEDITDNTFAPTPTPNPTHTPYPGQPTATPTEVAALNTPSPTTTLLPGEPTPTSLPGYMTAPPFKCEDYQSNKPFIISNIICNIGK
jgi:hypothetical protein